METTITGTEPSKRLSDVLNRVYYRGERCTVARNGEPVAVLVPAGAPHRITLGELAEQMRHVPLPDAGFADDVEAMRSS